MRKRKKTSAAFNAKDIKLTQDVKRANQRLRELEKQGMENSPAYRAVERLRLANDPAITTTGKGQMKFSTNLRKMSAEERQHLREEVKKFLEAETSTTKGAKAVAKRAQMAYKKHAGLPEDEDISGWLNLWSTAIVKQFKAIYGSDATEMVITKIIQSDLSYDEAVKFLEDHFGEPLSIIVEEFPTDQMQAGDTDPWDWEDIFEV